MRVQKGQIYWRGLPIEDVGRPCRDILRAEAFLTGGTNNDIAGDAESCNVAPRALRNLALIKQCANFAPLTTFKEHRSRGWLKIHHQSVAPRVTPGPTTIARKELRLTEI